MTRAFSIAQGAMNGGEPSKSATAESCGASRTNVPWNDPIAYVAKNIWPQKTIENFAAYIGCAPRTAQYILHSKRKTMRADFVRRLFLGEHGREFLEAWMSQSDAEWWQRICDLEQQQIENEKQLKAIREAIKGA